MKEKQSLGCLFKAIVAFFLVGTLCVCGIAVWSFVTAAQYHRLKGGGIPVVAVITNVIDRSDSDGSNYAVMVEYEYEGQTYEGEYGTFSSLKWEDYVGQTVELILNSEDPAQQLS